MIGKLLIIEAKLIHKVSRHLLDLVVWKCLKKHITTWIRLQSLITGAFNIWCVCLCTCTCCSVSSLGKGLSISSSEEGRGFPVPIWMPQMPHLSVFVITNSYYILQMNRCVCVYQVYGVLPIGLWQGLVHKGFPAPSVVLWQLYIKTHKNTGIKKTIFSRVAIVWIPSLIVTFFHMGMHTPVMRLLICVWTGPFSRLWTTVLAILVRCPMYPLLMPPSHLNTEVAHLGNPMCYCLLANTTSCNYFKVPHCILSFSSQASRILWTRWQCWNNLRATKIQSINGLNSKRASRSNAT